MTRAVFLPCAGNNCGDPLPARVQMTARGPKLRWWKDACASCGHIHHGGEWNDGELYAAWTEAEDETAQSPLDPRD